jgi:hypothetical protein
MKAKLFPLVVVSLMVGLSALVTACGPSADPVDASPAESGATEVVEAFYNWYVGYPGNVMAEGVYRSSEVLTPEFVQEIDELIASFEYGGYDPFLCAQDIPGDMVFDEAAVSGDEATVVVHEIWNPDTEFEQIRDLEVTLERVDGIWLIDNITCSQTPTASAPADPPEVTVEGFYGWYIDYARNEGNPAVDQAYRETGYLTPEFVEEVDELVASFENGGYDPFLCAQDIPAEFEVGSAIGTSDEATVVVHEIWNPGTEFELGHDVEVTLQLVDGNWLISGIACQGEREADLAYETVELPEAGLSVEIPEGWQRVDSEPVWTADGGTIELGVNWVDLEPPTEMEAALLPSPSQVLESSAVDVVWGSGRSFTIEVYGPAAEDEGQAPVEAYETHVLVSLEQSDGRRAFDFYASAPTWEEMTPLVSILDHLLYSAVPTAMAEEPTGEGEMVSGWQVFRDDEYGFQIQYPADWTFQEVELRYPELDAPIVRIIHFLPQEWADQMNAGGRPDPNNPIVAPLSLEVSEGSMEAYRQKYFEPAQSETVEIGGISVVRERDVAGDYYLLRTIFEHPLNEDLRVTMIDQISGFPMRIEGNEHIVTTMDQMMATFSFTR